MTSIFGTNEKVTFDARRRQFQFTFSGADFFVKIGLSPPELDTLAPSHQLSRMPFTMSPPESVNF